MRPTHNRAHLMMGVSLAAIALLGTLPARAQSVGAIRAAMGLPNVPANAIPMPGTPNLGSSSLVRDQGSATARQLATQARLANSIGLVTQAQAAARAAAQALAQTVPNGLRPGGLVPALNLVPAAQDATGLHTLQGALAPVQSGTDAAPVVTVTQTDPRAIVTWTSFNVGRDTTLNFDQKVGGVGQRDWVVFNRVVGGFDAATGRRDPTLAPTPSQILGKVNADGQVFVVNPNGVIFGATSQVRAGALVATTLRAGAPGFVIQQARIDSQAIPEIQRPQTLAEQNAAFLASPTLSLNLGSAFIQVPGAPGSPTGTIAAVAEANVEGDVEVAAGADIAVASGGTLFLAAPHVRNAGALSAVDGVVLVGAGRTIDIAQSTGATTSGPGQTNDADIRGLYIASTDVTDTVGAYISNTGSISSARGYLQLRTDRGAVLQQGVLSATTSASRNGFIDLAAADIALANGSAIAVTPDTNGETVPQSPDSVAAFKTSRVRLSGASQLAGGSLVYAPGARVEVSNGFVDTGATIDVGGIKDLSLPATRNQVVISPVKRNELRDTPNYREVGSFLNGATVYLDPRRSGVRADGTTWVGSPLIEAESAFQQIGITASELLTRGGSVRLGGVTLSNGAVVSGTGQIVVKPGATIDVSGGWVHYAAGQVQTSQLITRGGQIVDIGNADPNGDYVGLVNPFTTTNTRFGITQSFGNNTLQGVTQSPDYTEGRDAGALIVTARSVVLDGTLYGAAYAGSQQRANAVAGTRAATLAGDRRTLQTVAAQLPSGAFLSVDTLVSNGGEILVTQPGLVPSVASLPFAQPVSLSATNTLVRPAVANPASVLPTTRQGTVYLSAATLSAANLGQLELRTPGSLTFAGGTVTTLAPGGILDTLSGRRVLVDGAISAPSGTIEIATFGAQTSTAGTPGSGFNPDVPTQGSFDITVNGTLSVAGRFVNDFGLAPEQADGGGYAQGGAITLFAAPRVLGGTVTNPLDISGSVLVNPGALVDLSGGARVAASGTVSTTARGGDLALYAETTYAQLGLNIPFAQINTLPGLRVAPDAPFSGNVAANPPAITARVALAPGSVRAHGFAGGGTFTLATPAFAFGTDTATVGTTLPLDFIAQTGFANANIRVLKTALFANRITNGLGGTNALLDTNTVTIGAGQTLDLTQSRFSPLLSSDDVLALRSLPSGGSLYSVIAPARDAVPFDQLPIALNFSGLVELDIAEGGTVTGAAGASITAAKLFDAGAIRIAGGTVTALERLPNIYATTGPDTSAIGAHRLSDVIATRANGDIVEGDINAAGIRTSNGVLLTNRNLILSHPIYLLGQLDQNEGVRVGAGAVLDLSGASLVNPRAVTPAGAPIVDGRLVAGGTLQTITQNFAAPSLFQQRFASNFRASDTNPGLGVSADIAQRINALPGATIDLRGASDSYARLDASGTYVPTRQWSDGGTLGLRAGGTISGATVRAGGGDPLATGGTLVARDLLLAQTDPATSNTGAISATQIAASGFDTVIAEGSLNTLGPVDLTLRRAFLVRSAPFDGGVASEGSYGVTIGASGALSVTAPIIRFASIAQSVPAFATATPGTATASFTANALDVEGAVLFGPSLGAVTLTAARDLRLLGAQPFFTTVGASGQNVTASLIGQLVTQGDLTLAASQVYPTTGTNFTVASAAPKGTIRFTRTTTDVPATPYSAGSTLRVQAATIEQNGVLRAPLGQLTLGANTPLLAANGQQLAPATTSLHLGTASVTSVSADGLTIPYGTTTDQQEYFFTPTIAAELTAPPPALLTLGGASVTLDTGATVDLKGGGDVYAYEFVPGVGGSRDVLDRFNSDQFSSKTGFQYPDGRQVYAIVPGLKDSGLALVDPIYSADYAALTSSQVGRRVYLNAAPGLDAGWYTLLPARYALLPGGLRVVEQPEYGTAVPGASAKLLDGTTIVGGYYGTAGTNLQESQLRTFAVQTQDTFRKYTQIATTSADTVFPARAARNGLTAPRIPLDAGRLVIDAITSITANGTFQTNAAPGGRASSTDIRGTNFLIVGNAPATPAPTGTIVVTAGTLQALNSASLLIGATRTDNVDGTTALAITGRSVTLAADSSLTAPELLFAVDGAGSFIRLADGASLTTTGTLTDPRTGAYLIAGGTNGQTGAGALLRLSAGPERLVTRANVQLVATAPLLDVGLAHIAGNALLLDSSGDLRIASPATGAADIAVTNLALGANAVAFTAGPVTQGLRVTPALQAAFAKAQTLNIRAAQSVAFAPGAYGFGALTLDTPTLAAFGTTPGAVTLTTAALRLQNSAAQSLTCAPACGTATLGISASSIAFGSGQIRTTGFGGGVALASTGGVFFDGADNTNAAANNGAAGLDAGTAPLSLATSFLGDRSVALLPGQSALLPRLSLATTGTLTLAGNGTAPAVQGTPGARLSLSGSDIAITDTQVVATAGTLDVTATRGIALAGAARLATPGYAKVFGDSADPVTQSAPGGMLRLTAAQGDIALGANTLLSVGGGAGRSGELRLSAANGTVAANGLFDAKTTEGGGSLSILSRGSFDFDRFATTQAVGFDNAVQIRTGAGDLALAAGHSLAARTIGLTADAGAITIAGTLDASGVNGGDIALFGENGVTLASTGRLAARASGYDANDSRQASGGNVMLGTDGAGAIALAAGSTIDVSAARPGDRLVADVRGGQTFYRLAFGDRGGTLAIRAPLLADSTVNVSAAGTVTGARETSLEAFRRFDLAAVAASGQTGVTVAGGVAVLNPGATGANFLSGSGAGALPAFVQGFALTNAPATLAGLGTFAARPGIELDYAGGVRLAAAWNLGAGTVDVPAAIAAGDMARNPADATQVYVVPGREADLIQRFTTFLYRTGGRADGEAGVLTLRAGGTLDIAASLTDGFFAFRDQTTPAAISYAYGGGARTVQPIIAPDCTNGDCSNVQAFDPARIYTARNAVTIDFSKLLAGGTLTVPPAYNAAANTASPTGGDALGTADVLPRLATATGTRAAASTSFRLVGGADLATPAGTPSVDPLATTPNAANAGVIVRGETSYAVNPQSGPQVFAGTPGVLNIAATITDGTVNAYVASSLANFATEFANMDGIDTNAATILTLAGPGGANDRIGTLLNARARTFFAPGEARFGTGSGGRPTVTTSLARAGDFLAAVGADLGIAAAATPGTAPASVPSAQPAFATNYVRTRVRTGTGSIAIAAAGDIDMTGGALVQRVSAGGFTPLQVGGTSVYTAGARADLSPRTVTGPDGIARLVTPVPNTTSVFATGDPTFATPLLPVADALPTDAVYLDGGGNVALTAGGNVAGRRDIQGNYRNAAFNQTFVGAIDPWRPGTVSPTLDLRTNAQLFQTGIATLGGGTVRISAQGDVSDLTVVANTSVATATVTGGGAPTRAMVTAGGGDVAVNARRDLVAGIYDAGSGRIDLTVGRDARATGTVRILNGGQAFDERNAPIVRVTDATATLTARGQAVVHGVFAFGPNINFYTPIAGFRALADARFAFDYITYGNDIVRSGSIPQLNVTGTGQVEQAVLPGSFEATSLGGTIDLTPRPTVQLFLTPSPVGELRLFAGANLTPVAINVDDGDPGLLPGYFSNSGVVGRSFAFPTVLSSTNDQQRRLLHNASPTHAGDAEPVRIAVGGDIDTLRLNTPKLTRVTAARDILNAAVFAQNLSPADISRVAAGRDLVATTTVGQAYTANSTGGVGFNGPSLPIAQGNVFVLGGPGTFFVEAGRDAGPFLTSVVATAFNGQGTETLGGGVLSVGNDWNPWLRPVGANLVVQFGTGKGVNYAGLRDTYVDPANVSALPDDQFAQTVDPFGRFQADRTQPIYAPVLVQWTQANAASELTAAYGRTNVTPVEAYAVFKALPQLRQRQFLIEQVYFNELRQTSIPTSVSYLKYSRGYRAVNTLFPAALGYTANDLSGGGGTGTTAVETGNLDLRLATLETTRGGNIDILGPGGRVLGGSTVRTSAQAARRLTIAERVYDGIPTSGTSGVDPLFGSGAFPAAIASIPTGLEGVLTLRGGGINGFVDQNFLLNQSRLFTQAGGDIALWSSNGDLNAGQGPKTSANFPPVVVRFGTTGTSEIDAAGGVSGAGIAAFQPAPGVPAPNVFLIAPRGTVDAGDAGVRVAGNLFVAALSVANADNFSVGGSAFGIPSGPVVNVAAASAAGAASAAAQQAASAASNATNRRSVDPLSRITVDVLGYYGTSDPCDQVPRPSNCPAARR